MPPKKKKRRPAARSAVAPWVILGASLSIIGFACSRPPQPPQSVHNTRTRPPATPPAVAATAAPPVVAQTNAPVAAATASAVAPAASPSTAASPAPGVSAPGVSAPATTAPVAPAGPRLALIIDDCGQWLDTERGFIALPVPLTLSVLPDVRFNHTIEREAADGGKGVMLHLPMETLSGLNPGPGKVTTEMGDAAIATQVERDLADVDLARGVNNHEGSKATADARVMNDVMLVLARHNRFFIDSRTNLASVAEATATQRGVATAGRDVFLDNRADVDYTEAQLRSAVAIAKRDGSAIAIGHPRPTTLAAVRALIPEMRADGITFVLASELAH